MYIEDLSDILVYTNCFFLIWGVIGISNPNPLTPQLPLYVLMGVSQIFVVEGSKAMKVSQKILEKFGPCVTFLHWHLH